MTEHISQSYECLHPMRIFNVHVYLKNGNELWGNIKTRSTAAWPFVKNDDWLILEMETPYKGIMQVNPDEIVYVMYNEVKEE